MYAQMKLTNSYRIRLSDEDLQLLNELKKLRIKPTTFLRNAIREKIERELPKLIDAENKRKEKIKCPF
jgi:predicted DNA-binding protein